MLIFLAMFVAGSVMIVAAICNALGSSHPPTDPRPWRPVEPPPIHPNARCTIDAPTVLARTPTIYEVCRSLSAITAEQKRKTP